MFFASFSLIQFNLVTPGPAKKKHYLVVFSLMGLILTQHHCVPNEVGEKGAPDRRMSPDARVRWHLLDRTKSLFWYRASMVLLQASGLQLC